VVTFEALGANVDITQYGYLQCFNEDGGIPEEIVGFSWLPQYHDLGLVYCVIAPFASGWRMHMMSPITFMQDPLLWIKLIAKHKVQWGVAPDFAFNLVSKRAEQLAKETKKHSLHGLDLSSLRYLTTAAEPCRPETEANFTKAFAPFGLRQKWYSCGYGLAENVCGVAYVYVYESVHAPRGRFCKTIYLMR
jgi:acyl-CoA synthetase (AMP-forming)/AMP-acid ligase II